MAHGVVSAYSTLITLIYFSWEIGSSTSVKQHSQNCFSWCGFTPRGSAAISICWKCP